ncbi:MAG: PEP/pyruvate-binding domain-containing protein, partial [Anaerolineales bacterium]
QCAAKCPKKVDDAFNEQLAGQIGEYIGQLDKTVKAVFSLVPHETARPVNQGAIGHTQKQYRLNLVVWVERKSEALSALIETLESALTISLQKSGLNGNTGEEFILDANLIDDIDVAQRRGFGLVVENQTLQSRPVWQRLDVPDLRTGEDVLPQAPGVTYSLPESFDPLLMPEPRLIEHAFAIERIPAEERTMMEPHLTDLKVALIRRLISDQLEYIRVAKRWFSIDDLANIYHHRIGYGRIGGKSAGMLLAACILNRVAEDAIKSRVKIPDSYFLGSDLIYIFMSMNGLMYWNDQKYKPEDQIREEYPIIQDEFLAGSFPPEIVDQFRELLVKLSPNPLIVRSSSQLEDNFGTSFAGKYDSYFCPNQGTPEENLNDLMDAIKRTYVSTLKPEALLYRRSKGLQDYDERMAVLIQTVQGERFGDYFLPHASGVAFSQNIYRWAPQIRREAGFVRLVWGLGTRAVQRLGNDYPRLVALSHPTLQPDDSTEAIRRYSQHYVDLIDLSVNETKTLPINEVLTPDYPPLNLIAQVERDGFFVTPRMRLPYDDIPRLAINFEDFLNRTSFASLLSNILRLIEENYHASVDMEFAIRIEDPRSRSPKLVISLLQCRPQTYLEEIHPPSIPKGLAQEDILFSTRFMVPRGFLSSIQHIIFVRPEIYFRLPTAAARTMVSQAISRLSNQLPEKTFICIGPGRWGSINQDLGVYVSYADIHNAGALVEMSGREIGTGPEPSLGTHFFQDLMEAQIYPLAIPMDHKSTYFNAAFFKHAPNAIGSYLELDELTEKCVCLIDIAAYRPGCHVEVIMNDEENRAVAFLARAA